MTLSARYAEAVAYAADAHAGQVRKGTSIPYISHPLAVSALVLEHGGDEDQAIAALLHDVLEDCGDTMGRLSKIASDHGSMEWSEPVPTGWSVPMVPSLTGWLARRPL
jgi:(p)ppGpp synthase/HD superfamily hydrolase